MIPPLSQQPWQRRTGFLTNQGKWFPLPVTLWVLWVHCEMSISQKKLSSPLAIVKVLGIFPSSNFLSGNFLNVRLGQGAAGCNGSQGLRLGWVGGPSAKTRTNLGSCSLENFLFGKLSLGKYPWEVATW